jgi:glyceraldehyde 3-phosphate dehydrogenase
MAAKLAINGFGRIGRSIYRLFADAEDVDIVAINDIAPNRSLAYLLKYDTVMGRFRGDIKVDGDTMRAGRHTVKMLEIRDLAEVPWKDLGVEYVIESTGKYRHREALEKHLRAGAGVVILTVPAKDEIDATVVMGVNHEALKPEHRIISNASCTTNCLAPIAKILHESFGIQRGFMTTVHAYTNDQRLADVPHSDLRRSRAAAENIIPTTTGAARAVGKVMPELEGKLDGIAMRVPVPDGSTVDLVTLMDRTVTVAAVNDAVRSAAEGPMRSIIEYTDEAIVSSDVIGNSHSAIFDASSTRVVGGNYLKTLAWYDNEWGYACRVVDLARHMMKLR